MPLPSVAEIDAVLPQTQCGLCRYKSCHPYAEAITKGEAINRCPPGGVTTLLKLAALTGQDATPYITEMQQKAKPAARVVIREDICIGCTKCIQACPVDAIVGAAKQMHTVIAEECTGCELCIAPCPVDCIDIINIADLTATAQQIKADRARQRFEVRNLRLEKLSAQKAQKATGKMQLLHSRKAEIRAAVERVKNKKLICRMD